MYRTIVGLTAIGLLFVACATSLINLPPSESAYHTLDDPSSLRKNLSKEVLLIADNQFHSLRGEQSWLQQGISDKMVHVAIRPPLLDYYSDQLLRHILTQNKNKLFIHLGDAADIACTNEMTRFLTIMDQETGGDWLMAPGNHDSLYFGNYEKTAETWSKDCDITCSKESAFMDKQKFMEMYLENKLGDRFDSQSVSIGHQSEIHGPDFDAVVYWKIEPGKKENWDSFLLQFVNISASPDGDRVWMILLDTTHYGNDPKLLISPAGKRGKIGPEQWKIVETFIKNNQNDSFVLAGHSPLDELDNASIVKITKLKLKHALIYLSAHTHQGNWFVRQYKSNLTQVLELNIGSTTDARYMGSELIGPSYRTFQLYEHSKGYAIKSDLVRLNEDNLQCEDSWFLGEKFYTYDTRSLHFKKTKVCLLKKLVKFHRREQEKEFRLSSDNTPIESASGTGGSDKVRALITQLEHIQKTTRLNPKKVPDPLHYQACQAYWASLRENYEQPKIKLDQNKRATFKEGVTAVFVPAFR